MTKVNGLTGGAGRRLEGRVAWVTGGGRGLGRAIAKGLAREGAKVVVTARSTNQVEDVVEEISSMGGTALAAPGSVASVSDIGSIVDRVMSHYGALDVLVNNAGTSASLVPSVDLKDEEWRRVIDVNLSGAFFCARAAARHMLDVGGSIVNVSSVHGSVGASRMAAYSASKGGMELLTRSLALEWAGRGIRVNALAPGYFETEMTSELRSHDRWREGLVARVPLRRFGRAEEVVPALIYLASDDSAYVTGATIRVDGGWVAQ